MLFTIDTEPFTTFWASDVGHFWDVAGKTHTQSGIDFDIVWTYTIILDKEKHII